MDRPIISSVKEALEYIRNSEPEVRDTGICNNVRSYVEEFRWDEAMDVLHILFKRWPKFSGNTNFPVPDPKNETSGWLDAYNIYFSAAGADAIWDRENEYGQLRWELLDFCIEEIGHLSAQQKEIEDEQQN